MSIASDLIRGHTDTIILAQLLQEDSYGYKINKRIQELTQNEYELKEATLYTAFRRLEEAGYICSYWGNENTGARRRYYTITPEGRNAYRKLCSEWEIAIASIGDLDELLASLKDSSQTPNQMDSENYMAWRKKSAIRISVAIMLYILCVTPPIITDSLHLPDAIGACGLFVFIAIATGIIIYNSMTKPRYTKMDDTFMEDFKEWKSKNDTNKQAMRAIKSALWVFITALYFVISFTTMAWHISWVIFLIGAALESIIKAVFELKAN